MTERKMRSTSLLGQLLLVLMAGVLMYLVLTFVKQVGVSQQQQQELQRIKLRITSVAEEASALEAALEKARSSEAVRGLALSNGWAQPGEQLVVPVGSRVDPPAALSEDEGEEAGPDVPGEVWWDLFFGTR